MPASKVKKNRRPRSAEHTKALFLQATEEVFGSDADDGDRLEVAFRIDGQSVEIYSIRPIGITGRRRSNIRSRRLPTTRARKNGKSFDNGQT